MTRDRHRRHLVGAIAVGLLLLTGASSAFAAGGRLSFTQVQPQFMCVLCKEPLNEARSDEAYTENAYLRVLIAHNETLPQIKHAMVQQYGPGVLTVPSAHGFGLLAYLIPALVIVLGIGLLFLMIPRWRRRSRVQAASAPARAGPGISDEDARRLDADLARQS